MSRLRYVLVLVIICSGIVFWAGFSVLLEDYALKHHLKTNYIPNVLYKIKRPFVKVDEKKLPVLKLDIDQNNFNTLEEEINKRLATSSIQWTNRKKWIKANISFEGNKYEIKLRLRGDLSNNFNRGYENASYRINLIGKEKRLLGMDKFSLLRPSQEFNIYGYLHYSLNNLAGIITGKLKYVQIEINGKENGVYLIQEGFSNELYERYNRRGFILRPKNDCNENYWNISNGWLPEFELYEQNKVFKDSLKSIEYNSIIKSLNSLTPSSVFDIKKFSKHIALSELFMGHHGYVCHNTKLFYNIDSKLIEPIAWDLSYSSPEVAYFALLDKNYPKSFHQVLSQSPVYQVLTSDTNFLSAYTNELYKLVFDADINMLIDSFYTDITAIEQEVALPNSGIYLDTSFIVKNRNVIRREFAFANFLKIGYSNESQKLYIENKTILPVKIFEIAHNGNALFCNIFLKPRERYVVSSIMDKGEVRVKASIFSYSKELSIQSHSVD